MGFQTVDISFVRDICAVQQKKCASVCGVVDSMVTDSARKPRRQLSGNLGDIDLPYLGPV
jgi:hypothetical protein